MGTLLLIFLLSGFALEQTA